MKYYIFRTHHGVQGTVQHPASASKEFLEATSSDVTSSTSSDEVIEFLESEEEVLEYPQNSDVDGDSLDEGLGDISSDETIELLVEESAESQESEICQQEAIEISATTPKNEKERRPSRISFETPL